MNKTFIPIASDFMSAQEQQKLIASYSSIFENYGLIQAAKPQLKADNYYLILTGGTENKCLELIKDLDESVKIKIIAIGINNSLPASLEILAHLNQQGEEGKIYYLKNKKDLNGLSD